MVAHMESPKFKYEGKTNTLLSSQTDQLSMFSERGSEDATKTGNPANPANDEWLPESAPEIQLPISITERKKALTKPRIVEHPHTINILDQPYEDIRAIYSLGRELGRGQYGVIRLCKDRQSGESFACKCISKSKLSSSQDVEDVRREVKAMEILGDHPAVISLVDTVEDSRRVYLIMELCEGGDLYERITSRHRYPESEAASVFQTLASVVQHCHGRGVMHRDLKPENILLTTRDSHTDVKVVDYGLAMFMKPGETLHSMAGSAYYIAPEVLEGSYGFQADVWSIGVVLYILLCGLPPFWSEEEEGIFAAIQKGEYDLERGPWRKISPCAKDLVKRILVLDPQERITVDEIFEHPWIGEHCSLSDPEDADEAPMAAPVFGQLQADDLPAIPLSQVVTETSFPRSNSLESMVSMYSDVSPTGSRKWTTYRYSCSINSSSSSCSGQGVNTRPPPLAQVPSSMPVLPGFRPSLNLVRGGSGDLYSARNSMYRQNFLGPAQSPLNVQKFHSEDFTLHRVRESSEFHAELVPAVSMSTMASPMPQTLSISASLSMLEDELRSVDLDGEFGKLAMR